MTVADIADELFRELGEPEDISVPSIAFWLTTNIGQLNTLLNLNVAVGTDSEFSPTLSDAEKDIFKQLYTVTYYSRRVSANLGAAGYDSSILEVTEGNRTTRLVNRNEVAKSFQTLKRDEQNYLELLVS